MNGRTVILQAVRKLGDAARQITGRNGVSTEQIDLIIPHQANLNLLGALARQLEIPPARLSSTSTVMAIRAAPRSFSRLSKQKVKGV
jgi:3-oxoacyl-[acyl-carrier-protein] synthase-3